MNTIQKTIICSLTLWYLTSVGNSTETPTDICQEIVHLFGSAVSNFTLCSITNARPIHLCGLCVHQYISVVKTHDNFSATIDERGNLCQEYFTNLDRIEIVSEAYKYVNHLWRKANCDYCFENFPNGTLDSTPNNDTKHFDLLYHETKECFSKTMEGNDTCTKCKTFYTKLNANYIVLSTKYGENICLDIVDTMNTTRETWSQVFNCIREKRYEIWLHVGFGFVACLPLIFYLLALTLSNKQESKVMQQKRLAEVYATHSQGSSTRDGNNPSVSGTSQQSNPSSTSGYPRARTLR